MSENSNTHFEDLLPRPPVLSGDERRKQEKTGDYIPALFEWYKYVGSLNVFIGAIQRDSPAFRKIPKTHYHALIGLLNRTAKLILANAALSHEGKFGETTAILDRCIFETSIKIMWLCSDPSDDKFSRYYADGLKTEVEFKEKILETIAAHDGQAIPIEERMLKSIENHFSAAQMSEEDVASSKKLPSLATMIDKLEFGKLLYIIGQRMGSHHVHGTWSSLLIHYLDEDDFGGFKPRFSHNETNVNQYMYVPLLILRALSEYVRHVFNDPDDIRLFFRLFDEARDGLVEVYFKAIDDEPFEIAPWAHWSPP